jgi:hypothetical protein
MITVSYDMAVRLKDAGWEKETHFIWCDSVLFEFELWMDKYPIFYAPTFLEIWNELPKEIHFNKLECQHYTKSEVCETYCYGDACLHLQNGVKRTDIYRGRRC